MHKTSIVSAAAALLALAGVCFAQPPGITREMIETALPVEGAPRAEPGPYAVTSEAAFGSPGYLVFRPTNLDAFPAKDTLPGLHGTAFGGRDKKTLFAIVFYGAWGTPSARNRVIAIPTIAEGYKDRAK